ncbi:sterol-sensing domain of SREBP cleavage-activation-domain-containing protein [Apodospora peruviana]|uniref:Sterol regulatory element-binding protein cleavage-activating protein n=1 Tax=Apodospora peruviana TaxID=516989 RepID=A0AAE0IJT3_9PEZI|nr:sterol-sensing domain of SREBP cleavage-activation-domain-containing protein [Apodospora peruviana]
MIWYLLYPLRGTTEAPVLASTHPLRKAFSRYGTWAARHVETVLPLSTVAIFLLLYPLIFLYTTDASNITNGVSNLPHHVWTDARPLSERAVAEPDVIMRSIWVHGSYMKALERHVLLGALELQNELLGPTTDFNPRQPTNHRDLVDPLADMSREERDTFHIINGATPHSWFFHSPLQYWSGSADNITADRDIISTVNARKTQSTSVNVTLRHSIVFSGKRFEERRLIAADALVITLIHLRDSPVGRQWVRKAEKLATQLEDKWTIIPADGKSTSSQLYEFQFRPMSWLDWSILTVAYSLALFYLMFSLSKLRAVKSRLGLMVTILAQILASIGSSFTVCAIFKIDLSRVPYFAYPLVVLAISLENSFRLINAVIMTSSTISIGDRIGEAFGATAHVAVANRVQNLLILWGCSRITYPGVAAFCTFAAVAIIFDFFYMATFFLSVLSVDVRQRELIELEKASVKRHKVHQNSQATQGWIDGLRRFRLGEVTVSTRVAGTIVVLGFILIAQSHYAPESGRQWLNWIFSSKSADTSGLKSSLLVDIHQARSPTSWLRLQDHETAREVIKVVKPTANSYVARVYDPLVFVLKGSDRVPHSREPFFLPAVYDFMHNEIHRFSVVLFTVFIALMIFTKYLLGDAFNRPGEPQHPDDEPLLSVRSLTQGHALDVVKMAASSNGHLVSVGLDRLVQIWDIPSGSRGQVVSDTDDPTQDPFPVLGMAIDDESKWLALVSWHKVMVWGIERQRWDSAIQIDLSGQKPEAVFFAPGQAHSTPSLIIVRRNGTMVEMELESGEPQEFTICRTPLVWAVSCLEKSHVAQGAPQLSILTASKKNCIHVVRRCGVDAWVSTEVKLPGHGAKDVHSLIPMPMFSTYLIGRAASVDMVDLNTSAIVHTFKTEQMQPRSLRSTCSCRTAQSGLTSLVLSYINSQTGDLVIQTYLPKDDNDTIYSYNPSETHLRPWGETVQATRHVANPGVWEALSNGRIVGMRQKRLPQGGKEQPSSPVTAAAATVANGFRRRHHSGTTGEVPNNNNRSNNDRIWEAWVINHLDTQGSGPGTAPLETVPLNVDDEPEHLMISELGPLVRFGSASVAVGFGNVVKIVSVGHEHFDRPGDRLTSENLRNLTAAARRKKMAGGAARIRMA